MSVVQFPGGRPVPPRTAVEALLGEVAKVELDLARARLAQINQETRQASALWGWYCFKRAVFWGLVLWIVVTIAGAAKAGEFRTYYGASGNYAGSSSSSGKFTRYYDRQGQYEGSSVRRRR